MYNSHRPMASAVPANRTGELLEQLRTEFEAQTGRVGDYENQVNQQLHELELIRRKVYELEQAQLNMKGKYEEELARLHREIEARSGHGGPAQIAQPPPPVIGHATANYFGGMISGTPNNTGSALAPPPNQAHQDLGQTTNLPPHGAQPGVLNNASAPSQHNPFASYPPPLAAVNGLGPQAPQQAASPGPGRSRAHRGGPTPVTPQMTQTLPYNGSPQQNGQLVNSLAEMELEHVSPEYKKEGPDWFAIFNPAVRRVLDVHLMQSLEHGSVVCCVRFSLDGRLVATGCNRSAQIFDVSTGALIAKLQDSNASEDADLYIRSVCFSPDSRLLASGAEDKIIRVWDITSRSIKYQFTGHEQDIYSLDFSRNGRLIASGSGDRTVRIWDLMSNQQVLQLAIDDGVTTVAISPDNSLVAAGSLDKSVSVWDVNSGQLLERLEGEAGHKDSVYSVAFSPQGREIVSGSLDKTIKMWELTSTRNAAGAPARSGKCLRTFEGHKDFVLSVALTCDGAWVMSGSKDRGVQFWDPNTGIPQLMLQGHKNSVISVAPSPTGSMFATGSGDCRARIWSYEHIR